MRTKLWVTGVLSMMLSARAFCASEICYVVKVIGFDKTPTLQNMSDQELKELQKTIKLEAKYFQKALTAVAKEWRADDLNKGVSFPGSKLSARTIMGSTRYGSSDKADDAISKFQDQQKAREARKAHGPQGGRRQKPKSEEAREKDLEHAMDLVKAKLEELIAKAEGGAAAGGEMAVGDEKVGAKVGAEVKPQH